MLAGSQTALPEISSFPGERAAMPHAGADVGRLALALLNLAQKFEIEPGVPVTITPLVMAETLAGLAGGTVPGTARLLDHLCAAGIIARRRQRLVLWDLEALQRLALG